MPTSVVPITVIGARLLLGVNDTDEIIGCLDIIHHDVMMPKAIFVLINPLRDVIMRTTLTLDNDVIDKARAVAAKHRLTFRAVVNEALRIGLEEVEKSATRRPYRTEPHAMGLRAGYNLDNIQEVLSRAEGEDFR
ncbi:MAG TPA: hypothetical protein VIG57_09900 [Candidatus Entotheonella sp.]